MLDGCMGAATLCWDDREGISDAHSRKNENEIVNLKGGKSD
jgi:hypothetical protein